MKKPKHIVNCDTCGTEFRRYDTIQKTCVPCAIQKVKDQNEEKEKTWPERKKKMQRELMTRTQKINHARDIFQKYIRERDKNEGCISCDKPSGGWDAGHYLKAELYTGLIFNEDNVHKQCKKCNGPHGQGMPIEYRIGLVKRIGEERVKVLETIKDDLRVYRWEDAELEEIEKKYKKLLKSLRSK